MCGKATFAMLVSSTSMNVAIVTVKGLAHAHVGELCLAEVRDDPDVRLHEREERLARLDVGADLDRAARDAAAHGGEDLRVGELELGLAELRGRLLDLGLGGGDLRLRLRDLGAYGSGAGRRRAELRRRRAAGGARVVDRLL